MNRRSLPMGQTHSALLKAMLCALESSGDGAKLEAWLQEIHMVREDLDDETRPVPLSSVVRALAAFERATSRDAILDLWVHLIAPDNLGVWMRALRGTTTPAEAFVRLDASDSEYGRTTRWETLAAQPGRWQGRVHIAHDPSLEEGGLLHLSRLAELRAVPALFGFTGVRACALGPAAEARTGIAQDFQVTWERPSLARSCAIGGALGALVGATGLAVQLVPTGVVAVTFGGALGALVGAVRSRERERRAEAHAQTMRVHALERSLTLKESRDRLAAGYLEGTVAAGQYRLRKRMGSGATGVIYEAERISDGLPVAIKLLRAAAAHDAVASDRLRREAEALGLSWHPNVVEVIDHGHLPDGTSYLVMELLHGESLAGRVRSKGRLHPQELFPIAMQVCDALAAVHAAGVVHRDLKPSNIFLAVDRSDPAGSERVKLLDFGIARVEWEETRITNTGGPLGTPGYMSPEQETGGEVDGRSDIFALGAVLYECLVGEPPPPPSPSGMVRMGGEIKPGGRIDSGTQKAGKAVPPGWRSLIEKAMSLVPEDRFEDARAFAHALRAIREEIVKASS